MPNYSTATPRELPADVILSGDITPTSLAANANDYNPTDLASASTIRQASSVAVDITGLAGGADGRLMDIQNINAPGGAVITIKDESVLSAAANRFAISGDVAIGPETAATFQYDATASRWRSRSSAGAGGGGGGSIGGTIVGGTTGSVLFIGPASTMAQDNANLFWDDTNNRLGIGTAAPAVRFHISEAAPAGLAARIQNTDPTGAANWNITSGVGVGAQARLQAFGATYVQVGVSDIPNTGQLSGDGAGGLVIRSTSLGAGAPIRTFTGSPAEVERHRIDAAGNVVIGSAALALAATDGFPYSPTVPGTPSGVPTAFAGRAPWVFDSVGLKLWANMGGVWRDLSVSLSDTVPVNVTKAAASAGVATASARQDHKHDVSTGVPVNVTTATNAEGAATSLARSDHSHGIADDAVTYAKMQNVSAASRLVGRGSAAGAGDPEEITLGANLTMTGTVLAATGGGAAVTMLNKWDANLATFPTTAPAAGTSRNGHPLLAFDDGALVLDETVIFHDTLSSDYTGGSINVRIDWSAATAVVGNAKWGVEFEALAPGGQNLDADGFAAQQTAFTLTSATAGVLTRTTITLTNAQADAIAAGNAFRLRVKRMSSDTANDTIIGDAQILAVSLVQ